MPCLSCLSCFPVLMATTSSYTASELAGWWVSYTTPGLCWLWAEESATQLKQTTRCCCCFVTNEDTITESDGAWSSTFTPLTIERGACTLTAQEQKGRGIARGVSTFKACC